MENKNVNGCECCGKCTSCHLADVGETYCAKALGKCEVCHLGYLAGYYNGCGEIPKRYLSHVDADFIRELAAKMRGPSTTKDGKRRNIKGLETTAVT